MFSIVPEQDAAANPLVPVASRTLSVPKVTNGVGRRDFTSREGVAPALANEMLRADLTAELRAIAELHAGEDDLIDGVRYRFHEPGSHNYWSFVGPLALVNAGEPTATVRRRPADPSCSTSDWTEACSRYADGCLGLRSGRPEHGRATRDASRAALLRKLASLRPRFV